MPNFSATATAKGSSNTSTTPTTTVTSTATASATSSVSQQDAQTLANNTAQQIANSAAQNDANVISQTVNYITSTGIAGATGPTGANGRDGSQGPTGSTGPTGPAASGSSSPNATNTVYFDNITDMNNFQLPTPDPSGSQYYNVYLSSSLLGNSDNNFGFSIYPSPDSTHLKVLEYNTRVYMYGSIFDSSNSTYNNIISYDLSGNINSSFDFNYSTVNNIDKINTLSGTIVGNRLFAGFSGNVDTSYNGMIEISPTTGSIVTNTALQYLQTGSVVDLLIPDASNNLFLIGTNSSDLKISGITYNIVYYDISSNTLTGVNNVNETQIDPNIKVVYYYSGYLYIQYSIKTIVYTLNPNKTLTQRGIVLGTFYNPSSMAFVNGKIYLVNNNKLFQYSNYDLSSYNRQYTINSLNTLPSYISTINNFGSTLIVNQGGNNIKYFNIDNTDKNVLTNGLNPDIFGYTNVRIFNGISNIYITSESSPTLQYNPNNFSNFLVISTSNIDKVYIKNTDGTPLKLYYSFNSFYYNGSNWVLTATTNNYVN